MNAFDHPIRLGMVGCSPNRSDPKKGRHLTPQSRGKLASLVRDNTGRNAKTGNPPAEKSSGAGGSGNVLERKSLHPTGKPIDDREEIGTALGDRERADQVKIEGFKTAVRKRKIMERGLGVTEYLGTLAGLARTTKAANVTGHLLPDKAALDVGQCRI